MPKPGNRAANRLVIRFVTAKLKAENAQITLVTLCPQGDGTSVGASVRTLLSQLPRGGLKNDAAKQSPRTTSEVPTPSKSERILVVKEEETSREIIASMLARAGYECQEAGDGLEALALLDLSKGFDLLLAGLTI
jgi:hypothetical protein